MWWLIVGLFPFVSGNGFIYPPLFPALDISLQAAPSAACQTESSLLLQGLKNQSLWAMRMWDASAQGTTGALYGNMWQLGNFDECLRVHEPISAQYCLITVKSQLSDIPHPNSVWQFVQESSDPSYLRRDTLHAAICVPAACTAEDIQVALQAQVDLNDHTYPGVRHKVTVSPDLCTTTVEGEEFTAGEISFWVFCGLILTATILGTILRKTDTGGGLTCGLRCFSLPNNLERLLEVRSEDTAHPLAALHGVKVLSIMLVFYGHRLGVPLGVGVSNYQEVEELRRTAHNMFMPQADLIVDTFFFISGVLATYFMYHIISKHSINPFYALAARLWRIAPTYYFIVWFQASAAMRLGSGPMWNFIQRQERAICADYWWANIFFFSNYLPADKMCNVHSWFLPCDVHFFLLAIVLVTLLVRRPLIGKSVLMFLTLITPVFPAYIVYTYSVDPIIMFYDAFLTNPRGSIVFDTLYIQSHMRVTVYLIGICVGYYLYKHNSSKYTLPKILAIGSTFLGLGLLITPMAVGGLYYQKEAPGVVVSTAYAALRRPLWALGLAVLLLILRFSSRNFVSRILTSRPALVLSKLTFTIYLIHYLLILFNMAKTRSSKPFSIFDLVEQGSGDLLTSTAYAAVLYILLELPLKRLPREVTFRKSALDANGNTKACPPPQEIVTAKL